MIYLLKSRLYREELLRWCLILALALWAISATFVATTRRDKTIVIAVSDDTSYVIQNSNIARDQKELLGFTKMSLEKLYTFDAESFSKNLSSVSDLMSDELWQEKRESYLKIAERLKVDPLSQNSKLESIEQIDATHLTAIVRISIHHKIEVTEARVKVEIEIKKRERTELNPWMYEITGIKDALL